MTNVSLETCENLLNDYFEACGTYGWKIEPVFSEVDLEGRVYLATCLIGLSRADKDSLQSIWFENG